MNSKLCLIVIVLAVIVVSSTAFAEPAIKIYFDAALTQTEMDCPGPGLDTLYVVAEDFPALLIGADLQIHYPPSMIWLADLGTPPVTLGSSPNGVSLGFDVPQNAFGQKVLFAPLILWNCVDCSSENARVETDENPQTNTLGVVFWPSFDLLEVDPSFATLCQRDIVADMDIKPGSCPNPFNLKLFEFLDDGKPNKGGVLPVALHGSADFDVNDVDISTLLLEGVAPLSQGGGPKITDLGAPAHGSCDCTPAGGGDAYDDINMKFSSQQIAENIAEGVSGEEVALTLTGQLLDGTPFSATDCVTFVGRATPPQPNGGGVVLGPAVPNPFNPVTRITYYIPDDAHVELTLHNVRGQRVATLVNGTKSGGEHIVTWDAKGFPSGVYFYRLNVGEFAESRKVLLLK